MGEVVKSDAEWREELTAEQYEVCRNNGTEHAFTGRYWDFGEEGIYRCSACGSELFSSVDKYDSGTGWPSFTQPLAKERVCTEIDQRAGAIRTEALCGR